MIALDTNILVYAHRRDSPWFDAAQAVIAELVTKRLDWAIPWPCVHEFLSVVTHPKIYKEPTPTARAIDQVTAWLETGTVILLSENDDVWPILSRLVTAAKIVGPRVHDAKIAAVCQAHGIAELWTADRDFESFPQLRTRNPLVRP